MKRLITTVCLTIAAASSALAGPADAETSAAAGNTILGQSTAAATARYQGDHGFARTTTRSGDLTIARGVAVGVDENGLSLSVSHALAPKHGPALATNFSMTIGADGEVAHHTGLAVADGPIARSAQVSGRATSTPAGATATGSAGGTSDRFGRVRAVSRAESQRAPRVERIRRVVLR